MAILSTAAQARLQSAIDLLVNGTAYETPLSEDVIQRLAPVANELGLATVGGAYEGFKNNPKSALAALVGSCGQTVFSSTEGAQITDATDLMISGTAYETPWSEDVVQRLAAAADSSGYLTKGGFYEEIKLRPVSTMLRWALAVGSL